MIYAIIAKEKEYQVMSERSFVLRAIVPIVMMAACATEVGAAVVPISPRSGETVTLLPEGQRDVIAQPTYSSRVERLKGKWIGKNNAEDQWGMSRPLVLRWRVTDGEQGPWKIEIGKKGDMSDARIWLVADKKPHLPGEKDVFGLKLTDANLEVGQTYHWRIWSNVKCTRSVSCGSTLSAPCTCGHGKAACASSVVTFTTDGQPPRWIALEGRVKNVRDIGGWRTRDGRRVKQGLAFRGQGLNDDSVDGETAGSNRLTVEDINYLKDTLKIRTDLDLRTPSEVAGMTKSPIGDGVRFIHHPSPAYAGLFSKDGKGSSLADEGKKTMAANFRIFCDKKNYPIFFHCIGGTDRTGSLAYVLNAVLGVDRHDLEVDWESTLYPDRIPELRPDYSGKRGWRSKEFFDEGFAKYGDANTSWNDRVVLYLLDCGITKEEIEQFRSIMLEPQNHTIRDIPYAPENGKFGLGDLYLPEKVNASTPLVLTIHGGGWSGGDRASWEGVARFFTEQLGFAAFNIEYRLASVSNRWPACGNDCVKAARFVLSDEFKKRFSLAHRKIWICGGSAGGHLALWTLTHLPADDVDGCVSISAIGDPALDYAVHAGRYRALFGKAARSPSVLAEMDPRTAIVSGMAPLLCTHATEDKVVPIVSHKAFADAYSAAGNVCEVFEYPSAIREGLTGHCIWIPGSKPHRLIPEIEARIAKFVERGADDLWSRFVNPSDSAKPWCYWWWINGHADRETITADLEAMKRLGFGGVLMFDSRGYFDDDDHVVNPKAEIVWGSNEWQELVAFSIRECARLGLEFTMTASASGGTLNGFVDGQEYETDIMNREAVVAHLDRAMGPILKRVPDLVGKTFTHIYSPSYEGNVKTGGSWKTIKDTFYATMREWAHAHGLKLYSESGGPWGWGSKSTPLDCDQLDLLAHNDFPQGEFWPTCERGLTPIAGHANRYGRFYQRAIVLSARREGRRIASMEAFTHMYQHWSVDPAFLKPLADIAFADGANRLVWHTFTCSPKKFGIPGAEYFAGSHINRNVTWHKDAGAFVQYLARCQSLLQRGEPVDDGEFVNISTNYYGWGRYRKDTKAQFTTTHRREVDVDFFFVAGEGKGEVTLNASCEGRVVEIWDAVTGRRTVVATAPSPSREAEGGLATSCKTRVALDLPVGGSCFVVFGPNGRAGCPQPAETRRHGDTPPYQFPLTNAWHVSFAYHDGISAMPPASVEMPTLRDWTTYDGEGAAATSLRYFSGTATYRTTFSYSHNSIFSQFHNFTIAHNDERDKCVPPVSAREDTRPPVMLSLGKLPTGLAHVFVNDVDCGVVWCAPWEADISSAVRAGENEIEIRYTNNWYNRLVGDCFLEPEDRVTRSTLRYWNIPRAKTDPKRKGVLVPTVYSGPAISDPLQPSGILGPVFVK